MESAKFWRECVELYDRNRQLRPNYGNKNRQYAPNFDYDEGLIMGDLVPKASTSIESKMHSRNTKAGGNGLKAPPGFDAGRNFTGGTSDFDCENVNMWRNDMSESPIPRRKPVAATHMGGDATPHHYKGGKEGS